MQFVCEISISFTLPSQIAGVMIFMPLLDKPSKASIDMIVGPRISVHELSRGDISLEDSALSVICSPVRYTRIRT